MAKRVRGQFQQTFFCQAKSFWCTAFGKKIVVQYHQRLKLQISSLNWHTFCQTLCAIKASHPVCAKKAEHVC